MPNALRDKLFRWPDAPIYAALDGALFDDLPGLLRKAGFETLSLFLGQTDPEIVRVAPRFVMVPRDRLATFLEVPDVTTGGVFWNAPDCDRMAFYRHLRSLSMVRIPLPEARIEAGNRQTRAVVFRHFDPATVAVTLPCMTPSQKARMFGPAQTLLIAAPEGVLEAKYRDDWPEPQKGMLTFSREQMASISNALGLRSRRRIAAYLRETAAQKTAALTDDDLLGFVTATERLGRRFGLQSEAGFGRFAWLQLISNGDFIRSEKAQAMLQAQGDSPDRNLIRIMDQLAHVQSRTGPGA